MHNLCVCPKFFFFAGSWSQINYSSQLSSPRAQNVIFFIGSPRPIGIMGEQLCAPLQPIGAILSWCTEGFRGDLNWTPMMPRDARLSGGWLWEFHACPRIDWDPSRGITNHHTALLNGGNVSTPTNLPSVFDKCYGFVLTNYFSPEFKNIFWAYVSDDFKTDFFFKFFFLF